MQEKKIVKRSFSYLHTKTTCYYKFQLTFICFLEYVKCVRNQDILHIRSQHVVPKNNIHILFILGSKNL